MTGPRQRTKEASARPAAAGVGTPAADAAPAVVAMLEKYGPKLHSLALRLCGHRADAEDMVQDVFLQAFRSWHTFKGQSNPATWLYAIAARSCKARLRRKGGVDRRMPSMSQLLPWQEATVTRAAADPQGEQSGAERNEAILRVQNEIARLPEHLRVPLVMKEILGVTVEDVASALSLATNTVKTRLHRARLALRKAMVSTAPAVRAPSPIYERQVCLDLLQAKMAAMDRGGTSAGFGVPQAELCARCRAVFRELDVVQDACGQLASGDLPPNVKHAILKALRERQSHDQREGALPRRGRRPRGTSQKR